MNTVLAILAAIAAAIAAGLLWYRQSIGKQIALMAATATSKAGEVGKVAAGTLVEVTGALRCAKPATAEFSQQPCVYFQAEIEREETYYERDSQGRDQRKTRTTTVHSNTKHVPCQVEDETGSVPLDLDGASIEAVPVIDEYTANPGGTATAILSAIAGSNERYRRKESVLAVDIPVYVLGEVQGGGMIGKPAKGSANKTFVVSHKSEEERTKDLISTMRWLLWIAVALGVVSVGLLVWAVAAGR